MKYVAIKDMEMPKNCLDCPVRNYSNDEGNRCDLTGLYNREDCCPLVEIVTCKDCKHKVFLASDNEGNVKYMCDKHCKHITDKDFYCKDGKRRE